MTRNIGVRHLVTEVSLAVMAFSLSRIAIAQDSEPTPSSGASTGTASKVEGTVVSTTPPEAEDADIAAESDESRQSQKEPSTPASPDESVSPEDGNVSAEPGGGQTHAVGTTLPPETLEDHNNHEKPRRHLVIISYDMAVPVGDTWSYIGKFSPRGMTVEYRFYITPHLAAGALMGWNSFDVKERGTFIYDNVTITGTQIRAMEAMPISGSFHYNFLPSERLAVPFLGLDVGAYHLWRSIDFGWWNVTTSDWHFGIAPGLGVVLNLAGVSLLLGSKFHWAVKTSNADNEMYVTFNIGVGIFN